MSSHGLPKAGFLEIESRVDGKACPCVLITLFPFELLGCRVGGERRKLVGVSLLPGDEACGRRALGCQDTILPLGPPILPDVQPVPIATTARVWPLPHPVQSNQWSGDRSLTETESLQFPKSQPVTRLL